MPPAAGVVAGGDRMPVKPMMVQQLQPPLMTAAVSETYARDAILAWFRGEFAAANAIIDALFSHVMQLEGCEGGGLARDYESVFKAIHRRRLNWIPVLQMQRYYSIADVTLELQKVAEKKRGGGEVSEKKTDVLSNPDCISAFDEKEKKFESCVEISEDFQGEVLDENGGNEEETVDDSPHSEITDSGSQEAQPFHEHADICSNHEECESRRAHIKMTKGFVAKEPVKGHMVNVVRGLKLYEDIFTDIELSKLNNFVNDLRMAGRDGELSGETFILYNQQMKGNKRELIQLGVPIFGQINDVTDKSEKSNIEPIPALLQGVIEHLIQWHLIPENRKPNSCIINFFDEGEYSQPFLKPPHLDQPLSTLLLSESTMAFGRSLACDTEGKYRGPLTLSLNEGSLLVMRGNSSETARHVMCSSPNKRVAISFFKVRNLRIDAESISNSKAMTLWQPGVPTPYTYGPTDIIPKWGLLRSPMVKLAPLHPAAGSPRKVPHGGTGVFLPWTVGLRKAAKHLPPRAQRQRLLALPYPV